MLFMLCPHLTVQALRLSEGKGDLAIGAMPALRCLTIGDVGGDEMNVALGSISSLIDWQVGGLCQLPEQAGRTPSMISICCARVHESMSPNICVLTQYLRIEAMLTTEPEVLSGLARLTLLQLSCANLKQLPEAATRLRALQALRLEDLHETPEEWTEPDDE